ncbi:MAG TPA: wax ester/triacylglycerol synthase family O-acyltransferase [Candidatus Dormibacteraeota bacterium]|nr:wax ester/triacylglycerol synthase family O-acyltransferase [Candidatus Dormibacteraeota bacterium]
MAQEAAATYFEELSALDAFFLYAERDEAPLHIGAVYVFEDAGGRGARGIALTLEERLHLVPRYRQRVRFRPLNIGHPVWVDDAEFDLDRHVRRATLPRPGTDAQLRDLAARVLAQRLDPRRPLWEMTVVEGLSGGRVALIDKTHHAMVDGISSVDIATLLFDLEPEPVVHQPEPWRPRPAPDDLSLAMDSFDGLRRVTTGNPLTLPFRLPQLVRGAAQEALASPWAGAATLALSLVRPGPQLFFNRMIGPDRRLRHLAVPLAALKEVKDVFAATVNDVVLAVVAEAIARWLEERGEPPADVMRVFCPVSVRDDSQRYALGNLVSGMVVELPVGPMPPVTRLARVVTATGELKRSGQAVAARTLTAITSWAPATLHALGSRLASEPHFGLQSRVNMVVTNVPGPQVPFYTGGARLLEVWPFVPIYHTLGLNVALVSYDGAVHVGLNADRDLVPDLDRFARHVEASVAEFDAIARRLRRPFTRRGGGRPAGRRGASRPPS